MPRETLFADVGNPANLDTVPKQRTRITMPTQVAKPEEDHKRTKNLIVHAFVFCIGSFAATIFFAGWWTDDESIRVIALFGLFVFLLLRPTVPNFLRLPIAVVVWSFVTFSLRHLHIYRGQLLLVAAAAVLYLALRFRQHYYSCTLKTGWAKLKRPKVKRQAMIPAFFHAVTMWCCYGQHGTALPGMHRSPAGSCKYRVRLTAVVLLFLLFVLPPIPMHFFSPDEITMSEDVLPFLALFFCSFMAPLTLVLGTCFVVSGTILGRCCAVRQAEQSGSLFPKVFHELNKQLRHSRNKHERDSIYRGRVASDGSPILVPMSTSMAHELYVGSTRSGKTAYMQMQLESMLLRGDVSPIVLDLKADSYELLQSILAIAPIVRERCDIPLPVSWLTTKEGESSHLFSLMDQEFWATLSNVQKTDVEQAAMGISLSREYGPSWFGDVSFAHFLYLQQKYPDVKSFAEQAKRLDYELSQKGNRGIPEIVRKDGMHTKLILDRLALCDSINPRPHYSKKVLDNGIDFSRFYQEPCCLYAGLNAMLAPITSPEIARILLSSVLMAGMALPRSERKMKVVIIFDEWQTAISATSVLERALQQARSVGASLFLSNQTVADFHPGKADLTSTVYGNTAVQSWFSVRDPLGIDQLSKLGGKTVDYSVNESFGEGPNGRTHTRSFQQNVVNRFEPNDIALASSVQNQFFVRICINEGLSHYNGLPFVAKSEYHITEDIYRQRLNAPWPEAKRDTIIVGQQHEEEPKPKATPRKQGKSPVLSVESLGETLRPRKGTDK